MNENTSYTGLRKDILDFIEPCQLMSVLDVGCSTGINGEFVKEKYGAVVYGIEYNIDYCKKAELKLDKVFHVDLNKTSLSDLNIDQQFDYIIFGDILEHTINPWEILNNSKYLLKEKGEIIISIPNINHYSTLFALIFKNEWPYRKRGIHDSTHLRFFTEKNLIDMYNQCGLRIIKEKRNLRLIERGTILDHNKTLSFFLDLPYL